MKRIQIQLLDLHDAVHEHAMTGEGAEIRVVTSGRSGELDDFTRVWLEQLGLEQNVRRVWNETFGHAIGSCGHGHGKTE